MGWVLNRTIPDIYTEDTVQGNLHTCFQAPYPSVFWSINQTENDVIHMGELNYYTPCFNMPYPSVFWFPQSEDVIHGGELDYTKMGAFMAAKKLRKVTLPMSLVSIGEYAFAESSLKRVTIPNDETIYYPTSFPPNCIITGGHLIEP
jgi:hypothetical protein